jgi:hypothetical protein
MSLAELKLSVRAMNCLESENISTQLRRNDAQRSPRKAERVWAAPGDADAAPLGSSVSHRFVKHSSARHGQSHRRVLQGRKSCVIVSEVEFWGAAPLIGKRS